MVIDRGDPDARPQVGRGLAYFSRGQSGERCAHFDLAVLGDSSCDVLQRVIMLVLVLDERVLPGLGQGAGGVELLVEIPDLLGDVPHLHLVLQAVALLLHPFLLGLNQVQLLLQNRFLLLPNLSHPLETLVATLVDHHDDVLEGPVDLIQGPVDRVFESSQLLGNILVGVVEVLDAQMRLVQQNLGHSLYRNREGDHRVLAGAAVVMVTIRAEDAEDDITGLAEQQLLVGMDRTFGDDIAALAGHQVKQLVDQEAGRESDDPALREGDDLATYRTAKRAGVQGLGRDDAL